MTIRAPIQTRISPRQRPAELLTWIETLPPGEQARTIPQRQPDWPNPTLRRPNLDLRFWSDSLPPGEISRTIPLRQSDWQNPVRRIYSSSLYSVAYSQQIPQPVITALPFGQTDWALPVRRRDNVELRSWFAGLIGDTSGTPLLPVDWQNPVLRRDTGELRTWVKSLNVATIGAPLKQTEWPNPIRRVDSISLRVWVNGVPPQVPAQPLNQIDWPNPVRRVENPSLRSWTFSTRFELTVGNPLNQTDWLNPRWKPFAVELRSYYSAFIGSAAVPDVIYEIVPYLIGQFEDSARFMLTQVYLVPNVIGSGGVVQSQSIELGTLVPRGTVVTFTMGGTPNNGHRRRSRGQPPYNSGIV